MSSSFEADQLAGKTVGKYYIETLLGEGGMAYVYKGRHTELDSVVAIKVLFPEYLRRDIVRTRFKREARLQCKLLHPNIVRVIDLLEEGRLLGMVMDLVEGSDLAAYLKQRQSPMKLFTVRRLFLPILDAMGYAHSQGVIHRDLKPHNIMLHGRGGSEIPKVMDFGIARAAEDDGFKTKTGVVIGTPYYISPEQAMASKDIDHRTDVYALGVTLYQMLTGHLPFFGDSAVEVISGHCFRPIPSVRELRRDLDAGIDAVIQRALAKVPAERFEDCAAFSAALEKVLPRRGGDTSELGALPSLDVVYQSREDLEAIDPEFANEPSHVPPATPSQDSLHTRIEGWKQSQEDGPHPPLPSVSSSLPAVPAQIEENQEPSSPSRTGLPSGILQGKQSHITSPNTTPWLLAAIVVLVGGIGGVWALGGFNQRTRATIPPRAAKRMLAKTKTNGITPAKKPIAPPNTRKQKAPTKPLLRRALPAKRTAKRVAAVQRQRPKARAKRTPVKRRLPAPRKHARKPSKASLRRCRRCIKSFFDSLAKSDLMGHNLHALGGSACNYNDFIRVGRRCKRQCNRRYHTFCMSYVEHKTGQCQKLLRGTSLLLKLQSAYPDSNKLTALRCLRDWR